MVFLFRELNGMLDFMHSSIETTYKRHLVSDFIIVCVQEELEEGGQTTIYDDYKFLTREDLARLNLTNLIGTNLLRAYMHGFFIDYRLYKKVISFFT